MSRFTHDPFAELHKEPDWPKDIDYSEPDIKGQLLIENAGLKNRIEELEAQLAEMKPYIQHKYGCISRTPMYDETEDDLIIPPCDCGLDEIIHKEKGDEG